MSQGLCPSCGAAVKLTAGQTDTKCHYCDSVVTLQQAEAEFSEVKQSKFAGALMIAETALEGGSYEEAINYFNKVIEQEPSFADAWLNKGICMVRTSKIGDIKIPEAISSWKAAIKFARNPDAMKKRVGLQINNVVADFYPILEKHFLKFSNTDGSMQEHYERFLLLESALSLALELNPATTIAKSGVFLCDQFVASIQKSFDKIEGGIAEKLRGIADDLASELGATKAKYERVLADHDPALAAGFKAKQRKLRLKAALKAAAPREKTAEGCGCFSIAIWGSIAGLGSMMVGLEEKSPSWVFFALLCFIPAIVAYVKKEARQNGRDTNWMKALPTCFGTADLVLAGHPDDEDRFFALLKDALRAGFSLAEIRSEIEKHLEGRGCPAVNGSPISVSGQAGKRISGSQPFFS